MKENRKTDEPSPVSPERNWFLGELAGTFLLVFFGCGAVCASVFTGAQQGVFQVAIVWGVGIAVSIHMTDSLSGAHLNPAVTIAMLAWRKFPIHRVSGYLFGQFLGAFLAAAVLYLIFSDAISVFEKQSGIVRGQAGSEASAMAFGEFFPNPQAEPLDAEARNTMTHGRAFIAEVIATGILLFVIMGLTDPRNGSRPLLLTASLIGLTVTLLISIFAPLTMACFNPARDLGPRVFTALAGWGTHPFKVNGMGWFTVYIMAPVLGGLLGGGVYTKWMRYPLPEKKTG